MGSSQTGAQTRVPCISRQILNHCATREAPLIRSSASVILLLIPSRVFLISFIVLFIIVCLLFSSSRSSLNISCIYYILFPRFCILFTIITLNSFSGSLPVSSSFICSCGFLYCSFACKIFLCLLTLSNLQYLRSPFPRLQGHSSSCFCSLPPVVWLVQCLV